MLIGKVGHIELRRDEADGEIRLICLPGIQRLSPADRLTLAELLRDGPSRPAPEPPHR